MTMKNFKKGDIIFRRGDAGDCMYELLWGKIAFYIDYGTEREEKLSELDMEGFFGEMGLVEHEARSADAVVLEDARISVITEDDLGKLFEERPAKALLIMQHMCTRLRKLTKNYMSVCKTIAELSDAEEQSGGEENASEETLMRARYYSELAKRGRYFV